jgi:general secretion pathway protein A
VEEGCSLIVHGLSEDLESGLYLNFFGMKEQPFGVTPDPRFLYLSEAHREALASLYYGIEANRGFMGLIAQPGMGKTTMLFHMLETFRTSAHIAFLFQNHCNSREFMRLLTSADGLILGQKHASLLVCLLRSFAIEACPLRQGNMSDRNLWLK